MQYDTDLEALNAIASKLDTLNSNISSVNSSIKSGNTTLSNIQTALNTANDLLRAGNATRVEIQGEIVDIRNVPTDITIERFYIGDIENKRVATEKKIQELLRAGYRPYMITGISEDLARVVMCKYPAPNKSK